MNDIRTALIALKGQPVAFTVYCWLRCQIEANGGACDATLNGISTGVGLSVSAVHKAIHLLISNGIVHAAVFGKNRRVYTLS